METRKLEHLERRLKKSQTGRQIFDLLYTHAEEIFMLINQNRPVKVVWHRNNGPEFTAIIAKSGFENEVVVPKQVGEVKLEQLMLRISAAIQDQASPDLKKAIGIYYPVIAQWLGRFNNLSQLLDEFEKMDSAASSN
jgi:hypothetical protein